MARMLLMAPMLVTITAVVLAGPAMSVPTCTDTAPNTRTCVTPGHTAIVTTPNPALTNPLPGFGWGTTVFGLGGGGIWIGL